MIGKHSGNNEIYSWSFSESVMIIDTSFVHESSRWQEVIKSGDYAAVESKDGYALVEVVG